MPTTRITVLNLKGGTGKTTTTAHILQALHELGGRVIGFDTDPQRSLLRWHEQVRFPWPVVGQPTGKIHREWPSIVGDQWNIAGFDTPPTVERRAIVESAARAATHVLIPLTPATIEHAELAEVRDLLDGAREYDGTEFQEAVLLTKVKRSAASGEAYRATLEAAGWRVLRPIIPDLESYRQAWGAPLQRKHVLQYTDAVVELLEGRDAA